MLSNKNFFDALADNYDQMISFKDALERREKVIQQIIYPEMKSAADLGCGTGIDSIALTKLGLKVDGFDPSEEMIKKAKKNAEAEGVKSDFYIYPIDKVPDDFNNKYDLIISLGNTFANVERRLFERSIEKCYEMMNNGGVLVIHILNYNKIIKEQNRIVNITQSKDRYFIRFYDFGKDDINFNILSFNKVQPTEHNIITTKLFPYVKDDFEQSMKLAGFTSLKFGLNLKSDHFDIRTSKDLFIKAVKD